MPAALPEPGAEAPAVWDDGQLLERQGRGALAPAPIQLPVGIVPAAMAARGGSLIVAPTAGGILLKGSSGWETALQGIPISTIVPRRTAIVAALAILPADPNLVVGVSEVMQVLRSEDGGRSWSDDVNGAGQTEQRMLGTPRLAVAGTSLPLTVYCARARLGAGAMTYWQLFRTDDAGTTWRRVAKDTVLPGVVLGLEVSAADPEMVTVSTDAGSLVVVAR